MFLAALALIAQASIFSKVFPNPSGTNGYEELCRAADLVQDGKFRNSLWYTSSPLPGGDAPEVEGIDTKDKPFVIQQKLVERYSEALELVDKGLEKPIHPPRRNITPDTLFPEFAAFKSLAMLETVGAHVAFGEGRSDLGTKRLLSSLKFADSINAGGLLIGRLVSIACYAISYAEFNRDLGSLSLYDAQLIKHDMGERLMSPVSARSAIEDEKKLAASEINAIFAQAKPSGDPDTPDLSKLGPADRAQLKDEVESDVDQIGNHFEQLLDGDEANWHSGLPPVNERKASNLKDQILDMVSMDSMCESLVRAECKSRIQARLLYLHACVSEFRWLNGRLPSSLNECASENEVHDRVAGADFDYRKLGDSYKLVSKGFGDTGQIALKYIASQGTTSGGPSQP